MKDELKNKIAAQAAGFSENLPAELDGFTLQKIFAAVEDRFIFFSYVNDAIHCAATFYFHEETLEYKVRQRIGLTEFCLTKFFTQDFKKFRALIDSEILNVIKNLRGAVEGKPNQFLREKKIYEWAYELPPEWEGFELYIKPSAAVEVTNGSFIVINYADFSIESDFVIYYNIYGDEFSGERRIRNAPQVTYTFDAKTLSELEEKLAENLVTELREIRLLSE